MFRSMIPCAILAVTSAFISTGCMPKMTVDDMKAMMPQRPAELDHLDAFVGKWTFTGEAKMSNVDEPMTTHGTSEAHWDGDRRFIVSRGVFNMGGLGEMTGMETWTYDSHCKVYRSTWVDSMGMSGSGVGRYNQDTKTWKVCATSHGPFGTSTAKGTVSFPTPDTMEWTWSEYVMWGLIKTMEMTGTGHRQ